jgi:hypothetical protein
MRTLVKKGENAHTGKKRGKCAHIKNGEMLTLVKRGGGMPHW